MTDAQTEARAIVSAILVDERLAVGYQIETLADAIVEHIATALAAKNAELDGAVFLKDAAEAALRKREVEINKLHAQLAEARKALEQIERKICAAEHGHTINDVLANYREVRRTVQDARAARRALEAQGGE